MIKTDLYVGLVCVDIETLTYRTITHVATEGVGDSVAWTNPDGTEAGGSAEEFCQKHLPMHGAPVHSPHVVVHAENVNQRLADGKARIEAHHAEQDAIIEQVRLESEQTRAKAIEQARIEAEQTEQQ